MSGSPDDKLPVSRLRSIDRRCDRFEAALKAGQRVAVEDFLGEVAEPERSALRRELEALQAQLAGPTPNDGGHDRGHDGGNDDDGGSSVGPSLGQFVGRLIASGLMSADQVRQFREGLPSQRQPSSAEDLAKELFQQKKLTRFQAQAVYRGKTKGLVLGNYEVLDKIGAGGMGQVFKARHKRMK